MKPNYTPRQGQFLAFIYYYTKIHGQPPAEADMERYFKISPPSVHQMILTLEKKGFIERVPGKARSIRLLLPRIGVNLTAELMSLNSARSDMFIDKRRTSQ